MKNFNRIWKLIKKAEWTDETALTKLPGEDDVTFMGIYKKYHKDWDGWDYVDGVIRNLTDLGMSDREISRILCKNTHLIAKVKQFYITNYFIHPNFQANLIEDEKICANVVLSGINIGRRKATKILQKAINTIVVDYGKDHLKIVVDGVLGPKTAEMASLIGSGLNDEFNFREKNYYRWLAFVSPHHNRLARFYKGWIRRAELV